MRVQIVEGRYYRKNKDGSMDRYVAGDVVDVSRHMADRLVCKEVLTEVNTQGTIKRTKRPNTQETSEE